MCDDGLIGAYDEEGHAKISYVLNQLPLNKGRYRIDVYLLCHQGRYVYEWMDPLAHIELESEGKHQGPWMLAALGTPENGWNDTTVFRLATPRRQTRARCAAAAICSCRFSDTLYPKMSGTGNTRILNFAEAF